MAAIGRMLAGSRRIFFFFVGEFRRVHTLGAYTLRPIFVQCVGELPSVECSLKVTIFFLAELRCKTNQALYWLVQILSNVQGHDSNVG